MYANSFRLSILRLPKTLGNSPAAGNSLRMHGSRSSLAQRFPQEFGNKKAALQGGSQYLGPINLYCLGGVVAAGFGAAGVTPAGFAGPDVLPAGLGGAGTPDCAL